MIAECRFNTIGVVVPAHNEAAYLGACLHSLKIAAAHPALCHHTVVIVVALDQCEDSSFDIAVQADVHTVTLQARNVGAARHAAACVAIDSGAQWLAFTDADSRVAPDWLAAQMAVAASTQCELVCGVVAVDDWATYSPALRCEYEALYVSADGHRHIHGANLGVSVRAYVAVGGFKPLTCSEDVTLVRQVEDIGMCIAWSAAPQVKTSARRLAHVQGGFSDFLKTLEELLPARCDITLSLPAVDGTVVRGS